MSTSIRVACDDCGNVDITDNDIGIVCLAKRWSYNFACPNCGIRHGRWVSKDVVDLVVNIGVAPHMVDLPLEILEPKNGPPITEDDLIDLHFDLESL